MKKINFSVTKCTNKKCGFNIVSDPTKRICPLCGNKMVKDKNYKVYGFDDKDDAFIGFKKNDKRSSNGNNYRFRKTKNQKS